MTTSHIGSFTTLQYKAICEAFFKFPLDNESNINNKIKTLSVTDFKVWFDDICIKYRDSCFELILNWVAKNRGTYDPLTASDSEIDPIRSEYNQAILKTYKDIFENVLQEKFADFPLVIQKNKEWLEAYKAEIKDEALNIEVNNQPFKAIAACDVLWSGWEGEGAWVVVDNGVKKLVTSNHGSLNFTEASFLENKISEYKKAIEDSEQLLLLIKD